jgi:hypothetical protein
MASFDYVSKLTARHLNKDYAWIMNVINPDGQEV